MPSPTTATASTTFRASPPAFLLQLLGPLFVLSLALSLSLYVVILLLLRTEVGVQDLINALMGSAVALGVLLVHCVSFE